VNSFPILIRLRGFKLDRFIADTALRWSQFVDKSQECWHRAASEMRNGQIARATEFEGRGKRCLKGNCFYYTIQSAIGLQEASERTTMASAVNPRGNHGKPNQRASGASC